MKGLLLINLGTPTELSLPAVREYLRGLLMDPKVIRLPWPLRWLLVHGLILPRRPRHSLEAYRTIWTGRGSPLAYHMEDLVRGVQRDLGKDWWVAGAMRLGRPSVEQRLREGQEAGVTEWVVAPLYPQFSEATTVSTQEWVVREARRLKIAAPLRWVEPFFASPHYQSALQEAWNEAMQATSGYEHVVLSFHGLPESQIRNDHCLMAADCCAHPGTRLKTCYRAQCFETARLFAQAAGLSPSQWTVTFQSRLGRARWIGPETVSTLQELAQKGVKRIAILSPSFVADCLETLEEIGDRARHDFEVAGGEWLRLVPSLNSSPAWVKGLAQLARESVLSSKG